MDLINEYLTQLDKRVDIFGALQWRASPEKYLFIDYAILDLVDDRRPIAKHEAVEYVEDLFEKLLLAFDSTDNSGKFYNAHIDDYGHGLVDGLEGETK
jgi:hypothetical protein|tara:strand:- start:352 stop:645 length:294 start_codon:yes stop_codon:yes gene_type:complete